MEKLNANKFGLALGLASLLAYLVCFVLVMALPLEATIAAGNMLFHGIDVTGIASKQIGLFDAAGGAIIWFAVSAAFGYALAAIYNALEGKVEGKRK